MFTRCRCSHIRTLTNLLSSVMQPSSCTAAKASAFAPAQPAPQSAP